MWRQVDGHCANVLIGEDSKPRSDVNRAGKSVRTSFGEKTNGSNHKRAQKTDYSRLHKWHGIAISPAWEINSRFAVCRACCHHDPLALRCNISGKICDTYRWQPNSLAVASERCPRGKWGQPHVRWVRTEELVAGAYALAEQLPPDVSRIVGVPRSGMLPAAIIATHLHLPLFTLLDGEVVPVGGGYRMDEYVERPGHWVLVDDTVGTGTTWQRLRDQGIPVDDFVRVVVYAGPEAASLAHFWHQILPVPHLLQWNLPNCPYAQHAAWDMDGIIVHNPPHHDVPHILPRKYPTVVITSRPECERLKTERWLEAHGITIRQLTMWPGGYDDRTVDSVSAWKSEEYHKLDNMEFYIESEPCIAEGMRARHVRVLCPQEGRLA